MKKKIPTNIYSHFLSLVRFSLIILQFLKLPSFFLTKIYAIKFDLGVLTKPVPALTHIHITTAWDCMKGFALKNIMLLFVSVIFLPSEINLSCLSFHSKSFLYESQFLKILPLSIQFYECKRLLA